MTYPAVFVDFNGTICFDHFWRSAEKPVQQAVRELLFQSDDDLVQQWMMGEFTSEEINARVARLANVDEKYLWDCFVNDCKSMFIKPTILKMLQQLQEKYTVILMTDNMDCFNRFTVPALELEKYFHHIANSYDYRLLKNQHEGGWFDVVARELNIDIRQSFLLDDSDDVLRIFQQKGGRIHHVKTTDCAERFLCTLM